MRLSNAIRLGAMLYPQGLRNLFQDGRSCALGAALIACGKDPNVVGCDGVAELWPYVMVLVSCPVCDERKRAMWQIASFHLNDKHAWTREQIADWVATLEAAQALEPPASTNAVDPHADVLEGVLRA